MDMNANIPTEISSSVTKVRRTNTKYNY